jgi:hypothetical protein
MRNSRDIEKKALETGNSLHRGPRWGTWRGGGGGSFTGTLEGQMKESSGNGASLINFINLIWTAFFLPRLC